MCHTLIRKAFSKLARLTATKQNKTQPILPFSFHAASAKPKPTKKNYVFGWKRMMIQIKKIRLWMCVQTGIFWPKRIK
jgi:hypothetical protein